ncbi:HHHH-motif protein [Burkholderia multivorans]|nr:HHHH-motif protein [Burkholderia multivorans]
MKRIAKILTAAAVACAVLAPALAEAHAHRVCHFDDHHHHRMCRWVH